MNNNPDKPAWMQDPMVQSIPAFKLRFLHDFFKQADVQKTLLAQKNSGRNPSQKEMLLTFLPLLKKAKAEKITFSPEEIQTVITAIKSCSSAEEVQQMDQIYEQFSSMQGTKKEERT